MYSKPQLLQGVFAFEGHGLHASHALPNGPTYTVPVGKRTQFVYFRAGNSAPELICVTLLRDVHVALAVVEDLQSGTTLEVSVAAPEGVSGSVVLDIGLVEV